MASSSNVELSELDKKIAALEAAIENSTSDSDESDSSDSEESETNQGTVKNEKKKVESNESSESDDGSDLESIPPLPAHLLPPSGTRGNRDTDGIKPKRKKRRTTGSGKHFKSHYCSVCPGIYISSHEDFLKHKRNIIHRQNLVLEAGAAYEPSQKRASYCRFCKIQFKDSEKFLEHKVLDSHKDAVREERRKSFCQICRKQFTSATQLREHCIGKAHKEMLDKKKSNW
eukprot:CAMPEP_0184018832 /NCGR_PEP_ID=MMETSP0954-20121128/8384_1 /TAXON_ID=627963 /ORGANISM="Aplanochytrium sp, Strain PBS07" /LENGTH=228 /DNA_ID=CAMNT_0026300369 /DNA_START=207 /DNA_END=890 /DNA_ORIENTATION=-